MWSVECVECVVWSVCACMWDICGECSVYVHVCVWCACGVWSVCESACVCVVCGVWRCGGVCGVECMCMCVQSVSVIKNRQVFPWDPLQSTPGDRLYTQVFPGTAHHRGQTTQRDLPLAPHPSWGTRVCCLYT